MRKRRLKQKIMVAACTLAAMITASLLIIIVGFIFLKGYSALSIDLLTHEEFTPPGVPQGIANAIIGTLVLSLCSIILATPLAIALAVYMSEYAKENLFTKLLRFLIDLLAGTPAIILGAIGFIILVWHFKYITGGYSLIAGAISLAILILPTIERSAEESLKKTPDNLKEGAYALGSTKWDVIRKICIPHALPGIITGIILGIGRSAEESSVIVITAGYSQFMPAFETIKKYDSTINATIIKVGPFQESVGSLPISLYNSYQNPGAKPIEIVFATAMVLIVLVLSINLFAKYISKKYGMNSR